MSLVNDNAAIFIASDSVGNIGRELTISLIVFLFFTSIMASAMSSPALGARIWTPKICLTLSPLDHSLKVKIFDFQFNAGDAVMFGEMQDFSGVEKRF